MSAGNYTRTEEHNKNNSIAIKKLWKSAEYRKKLTNKKRTKAQRINIGIGTKKALNKPEIKCKMKKPKTEKHKKKLRIASMGNKNAKEAKRSKAFKENCKKAMQGKQNAKGTKHSKKARENNSKASKINWKNPEYIKKRLRALHKHHIYLDGDNKKTLMLTSSKHFQLHSRAYDYLVKINKINNYIKWFDKEYGLFKRRKK